MSTADQKLSVLSAIGNCSQNPCFAKQEIYQTVIDNLGEFLKIETHEATLHFAYEQLNLCFKNIQVSNLQAAFALKLKEFFKVFDFFSSFLLSFVINNIKKISLLKLEIVG